MNKPLTNTDQLKRLRYRSSHRGCKETDLILGQFSEEKLANLMDSELAIYEELLDEDDAHIWDWLVGNAPAPEKYAALLNTLKNYHV
jgi:antitoxin CptB